MCNNIMRKFLKLHKFTSMYMLIGELELKQIDEYIDNRMLNFWHNIATDEESKISSVLYKWVKDLYDQNIFKSVWLDKVKATIDGIGMSNCFNELINTKSSWFKNTIKFKYIL